MTTAYVLRTCSADGKSHGDFQWPLTVGATVTAPDWEPTPECGHGLHGLLDGVGDYSLLSSDHDAVWMVLAVEREQCVDLGGKVKFPSCTIEYIGPMVGALIRISREWASGNYAHAATSGECAHAATSGECAHAATSGNYAHAATSGECAHAATSGYRAHAATSGNYAHAATSGDGAHAATSGECAHAATSGECAHAATSGYRAIAASLGVGGMATAGPDGCVIVGYRDVAGRPRVVVGYVGEDGIEAGVEYSAQDGKLVAA